MNVLMANFKPTTSNKKADTSTVLEMSAVATETPGRKHPSFHYGKEVEQSSGHYTWRKVQVVVYSFNRNKCQTAPATSSVRKKKN